MSEIFLRVEDDREGGRVRGSNAPRYAARSLLRVVVWPAVVVGRSGCVETVESSALLDDDNDDDEFLRGGLMTLAVTYIRGRLADTVVRVAVSCERHDMHGADGKDWRGQRWSMAGGNGMVD